MQANKEQALPLTSEEIRRQLGMDLIDAQREAQKDQTKIIQNNACNLKTDPI